MDNIRHKKAKSRGIIRLEYLFFLMFYKTLEWMPLAFSMKMASSSLKLLFFIDRRHAQRTIRHIMYSGLETDPVKAKKLALANFAEFGKLLVEIAKIRKLYSLDKVRFSGSENARKIFFDKDGKRQFILASAHYGNWEVAGSLLAEAGNISIVSLMRSFANPLIGEKILSHRSNANHELVDKTKGLRPILQAINQGKSVSMVVDQHAASAEGVEVEFFGHPARQHKTPALLHLKTGLPIIPVLVRRTSDNFEFECIFGEVIAPAPTGDKERDIAYITQQVAWSIEDIIRQDPVQWLLSPRHWLSIERRQAAEYANWKPRFSRSELEHSKIQE